MVARRRQIPYARIGDAARGLTLQGGPHENAGVVGAMV